MGRSNIKSILPRHAIPGGEIEILCENFLIDPGGEYGCFANGERCRIVGASANRVLAVLPETVDTAIGIHLESGGDKSESYAITVGKKLADGMHIVMNPAVDPKDDSIVMTMSGSRGQQFEHTLFRLEPDGYVDELPVEIMNPTAIAFSPSGAMYVTNRADGEVSRIDRGEEAVPFATGLGIATGLAFDKEGIMYVGDRSGTIYRVPEFGRAETHAVLEPSVSAYHIAFGPDDRLYVAAPGLASFDAVHVIDSEGGVETYARGFGRPQGLAFDREGNLYVAACYRGKHGIARIDVGTRDVEMFVAGMNVVGLCFTRKGEMIVATNESIYSLPVGIWGTLLD